MWIAINKKFWRIFHPFAKKTLLGKFEKKFQACRGYEISYPYLYPYPQIFCGYPWTYPNPQTPILRTYKATKFSKLFKNRMKV